jgi:starch synthase (maltosyl-transferring)
MLNQSRVVIENVYPQLDGGDHPIRRVVGQSIEVTADILADGHDAVESAVRYKHESDTEWGESRMYDVGNDVRKGHFKVSKQGYYNYHVEGWVDYALSWLYGTQRKIHDGQYVRSELLEGAEYIKNIIDRVNDHERYILGELSYFFTEEKEYHNAIDDHRLSELRAIFYKYPEKKLVNKSKDYKVYVDRQKALFSTWYEFFPRSASSQEGVHGTFKDCEHILPKIAEMGFDTLYFPPIHPIGEVNRKGKNNATVAGAEDVGSPWGIGSQYGGHKSVHPQLGTVEDFKALVHRAKEYGLEVAMDFALQCAPDHPYVKEHPDWFKWRPDGTVQYAENPPKKYQDILPIYFESKAWKKLWKELLDAMMYWIETCDIRVFRVDNPHTKPFYFWGWLIAEVKKKHPDVLFLSEAFTKQKVMMELAKQGFTQSYTYFSWRSSKWELMDYVNELTKSTYREFFRPNFWPNTPDINPGHLQGGNEAMHMIRYFLAATLSSNTGIYGPVFEQMVSAALPGKEEYLDSEKYQIRHWNWYVENKLTTIIGKINRIRKIQTSLQQTNNINFCDTDNDNLLAYYKYDDDKQNETLMIVSLEPYHTVQGWVKLPLYDFGVHHGHQLEMQDLITGSTYHWNSEWCFVELNPGMPFHLFKVNK